MGEDPAYGERERDLDRLLTFVDAIVAIAITLLVLPLVELTAEIGADEPVADVLAEHRPELWSFLLSFAVIARIWFAQHRAVAHLLVSHSRVSQLLMVWSLTIVFLPFPTALVARAGDQATSKVLYLGTMVLSTLTIAFVEWVIVAHPEITDGVLPRPESALVTAALLALALIVTLLVPATGYFPVLLLLLEGVVRRVLHRVRHRARR